MGSNGENYDDGDEYYGDGLVFVSASGGGGGCDCVLPLRFRRSRRRGCERRDDYGDVDGILHTSYPSGSISSMCEGGRGGRGLRGGRRLTTTETRSMETRSMGTFPVARGAVNGAALN